MSVIMRVFIVVAVIVLGYPAAAWIIGMSAEKQIEAREQQALRAVPYVTIVNRTYSRGVYGATEEVTYGLGGAFTNALKTAPGEAFLRNARLTVRNTIHHGPFPGMGRFALATIDTELVLPAELRKQLDKPLGGKPIISAHTTMRWGGGTHVEVVSPAFAMEVSPGQTLTWRGLTGSGDATADQQSMTADYTFNGVQFHSDKGSGELGQIRGTADLSKVFKTLTAGKISGTVDKLEIQPPAPQPAIAMQQLRVAIDSAVKGDYIDSKFDLSIGKLSVPSFEATQLGYAFEIDHQYGPAAAALTEKIRDLSQRNAQGANTLQANPQEILDVFKHEGVDLLLHDLTINISRIGFVTPEGEARLAAKITTSGLTKEDFSKTGPELIAAVVPHINATADIAMDVALLAKFTAGNPKGEQFQTQLQELQKQGYVLSNEKTLSAHVAFTGGRLTVNDMPFPPTPSARPAQEAPPPPAPRRRRGAK